jgi:peptidoglycan/LPS O-acetylase OafA/YrhL
MQFSASHRLDSYLGSRKNNLDLLRLIAASLVIFGHSYHVVGKGIEPFLAWNGRYFIGGFALYIFFFASGLLVTNSFLKNPDILHWVVSRVLRIIPALAVCLILSILLLGGLTTILPVNQYFGSYETWDYLFSNLLFWETKYFLPGVFATNLDQAVNGPLWSIHLEVKLYICAGVLMWVFRRQRREWLTAAIGAIALLGILNPSWVFFMGVNETHITCSALFAMGAVCALWSDKVVISNVWLVVLGLACIKFAQTDSFVPVSFFFICYFVLCFAFFKPLTILRLPGDYSYGLYIYGWPVQQLMVKYFPAWSPEQNAVSSILVALLLAASSWYLIEKGALALKKPATANIRRHLFAIATKIKTPSFRSRGKWILIGSGGVLIGGLVLYIGATKLLEARHRIISFGPLEIIAEQRFNVQPDGLSAMWVQLSSTVSERSVVVFRGRKLKSAVNGNIITASVPDDLLQQAGEVDFYVLDESSVPSRRTPVSTLQVVARP